MRQRAAVMYRRRLAAAAIAGAGWLLAPPAIAASVDTDRFAPCVNGAIAELRLSIEAHNENAYKLNQKFKDVWYPQGRAPEEVRKAISLEQIQAYLAALRPRRTAVLFHAAGPDRLCTWLVTHGGAVISDMRIVGASFAGPLRPDAWLRLGVRGLERPRTATLLDGAGAPGSLATAQEWDPVVRDIARLLLPPPVERALQAEDIETLIVVPISIRRIYFDRERPDASPTQADAKGSLGGLPAESRAALSVGVVPFAALPVGGGVLLQRTSVVVAPGFFSFAAEPPFPRARFAAPIVVGDPEHPRFRPLPGARQEAVEVARLLHAEPIVGKSATRARVEAEVRQQAGTVELIHLATHGVADAENPVDQSYLAFSDTPWNARDIGNLRTAAGTGSGGRATGKDLPLLARKPLVVMSACQTALGKDFPAGTIGLARAWHWAGASNVVMSLWSVDDDVTRELMTRFVELAIGGKPVDKALQSAMLAVRERHPSPAHWASFGTFGAPERLPANR